MSIVSNNIKYLRRLNGLTQEQFARKIGIKRSLLGAYEEARANPNLTNLKNMAATFGVSVDSLLKNDLRKIRETPQLTTTSVNQNSSVPSPLLHEPVPEPQSLASVMNSHPLPRQDVKIIARPVSFKPVNYIDFDSAQPEEKAAPVRSRQDESPFRPSVPDNQPVDKFESDVFSNTSPKSAVNQPLIPFIGRDQELTYLNHLYDGAFLQKLPVIQLPGLGEGTFRAFEAGSDFPLTGTIMVGQRINNLHEIKDGESYLLLLRNEGSVYRRVFNQIRVKGVIALFSDVAGVANTEVSSRDVLEVYKVVWFISKQLSLPQQVDLHRVKELISELQKEIQHSVP
jgi:transcriptional regulator with XRE-family HTH domain